jgi:hypothetical protein
MKGKSIIFNLSHICRLILFYKALAQTIWIGRVAEKNSGKNRRVLKDIDISFKDDAHSV